MKIVDRMKHHIKRIIVSSLAVLLPFFLIAVISVETSAQNHKLWYDKPAHTWTEALPLGNGRLGAMVYGNPAVEHIQLNEETLWAGQPNNNPNPEALTYIPKIRQLVFEKKYLAAQTLATEKVMSHTNSGMPYQTFGDLYISFPDHASYTSYYRELSLDSARTLVSYKVGGVTYQRETITSFPDQVMMVHLTASRPGKISCNALFTSPHDKVSVTSDENSVSLSGVSSSHEGLKGKVQFIGRMMARIKGGKQRCRNGVLSIEGADEAVIYVTIATNFNNYKDISGDPEKKVENYLVNALKHTYQESKQAHVSFFKKEMDRVSLNLGADKYPNLTTDKRVQYFKDNQDNNLVATYFRFGRYLLICSSQPGGQPANLQGIWNDQLFPSWDSKYTCNINLEMNYWPAEVTNLSELNDPLFQLIKEVSQSGKETAKIMYGAGGWVLHHNTDIWRVTGAIDKAPSGMWPTGEAWVCQHLWQHYLYTGDLKFLRSVYPELKGAAKFLDEIMVHEPLHHWLVVCPSLSPEHEHPGDGGKATTVAGCTLDNQLVFDLWNEIIMVSKVLNIDTAFATHLKQRLKELPPMQIGRWGQLQEWMEDWDDPSDTHRHISHLYGLFPSNELSPYRTPEFFDAARTSLIHRGDESTGWSMGWKVCLWARLLDGDHAYKLITDQLSLVGNEKKKGGTYPNLFDAHPPFQIDGNFGCTAGIAEMLLQSYDGFIYLLPALPTVWKEGHFKGLVARGGFVVDLYWKDGKVKKLIVKSRNGGVCRLRSLNRLAGRGLRKARGENPNSLFAVPNTPQPLINEKAKLNPVILKKTYLYDLKTQSGEVYIIEGK